MAVSCYDLHLDNTNIGDETELVLIKFPSMRSQFENEADKIQLSMKPKSQKLKLEVDLEIKSSTFSRERAEVLACKSMPRTFSNNLVDKNFYTSVRAPVEDGQLFVCKLINDRLVCRPVSSVLTMRSDFTHLDLRDEVDPKEEVRPVSVKFAGPERQHTTARIQESQQEVFDDNMDEYRPLIYKTISSKEANLQRDILFGKQLPKVKPDPDAEPEDVKPSIAFIPDVKPKIERMDVDDIYSSETTGTQISPRKSNQIKQRVKDCLFKAKIVSFEEVYHYIRNNNNSEHIQLNNKDILDALSELALLVQGNWAIKSEILYGDSSERECTDITGISINLFIAARDYLLWLFTQDRLVSRVEYSRKVRMPDHDILELFSQLASFRNDIKKWEIKLATDERFLEQFPDVVQRQATFWKVRRANKLSIFNA